MSGLIVYACECSATLYSLRDLIEQSKGRLVPFLQKVMKEYVKHITESCQSCLGKGFICELCDHGRATSGKKAVPLFPWQFALVRRCDVCKMVYHQKCFTPTTPCPKCERINKHRLRHQQQQPPPPPSQPQQ